MARFYESGRGLPHVLAAHYENMSDSYNEDDRNRDPNGRWANTPKTNVQSSVRLSETPLHHEWSDIEGARDILKGVSGYMEQILPIFRGEKDDDIGLAAKSWGFTETHPGVYELSRPSTDAKISHHWDHSLSTQLRDRRAGVSGTYTEYADGSVSREVRVGREYANQRFDYPGGKSRLWFRSGDVTYSQETDGDEYSVIDDNLSIKRDPSGAFFCVEDSPDNPLLTGCPVETPIGPEEVERLAPNAFQRGYPLGQMCEDANRLLGPRN